MNVAPHFGLLHRYTILASTVSLTALHGATGPSSGSTTAPSAFLAN
jgi:hypothetical protein